MHDQRPATSELERLREERAALAREVERLREELAQARRMAARRDEAQAAETLGRAGKLAASEARSAAAEIDASAAWTRAAELGAALGRRIAEGQARLIASQTALASLERANAGLAAGQAAIALREADLVAVIESAIDCAIVTTNRAGLALAWNSGARRLLGWDESSAMAMDLGTVLPSEERAAGVLAADIASALSGARVSREGWLHRQDGTAVWAGIEAVALRVDGREEPVGVLWMLRDLGGAHLASAALREREERLRGVLDGMTEGFGLLAPDFTILEHNREALRMGGRRREEIVGRSHWEVYPGTKGSELGRLLEHAMTARVPVSLEHCYAFENGVARWLDMRAYPTDDGALAVFWREVTDRKTAEAALRESEARYRALFEAMDEGYCVIEVLFDAEGRPDDFRYVEVNAAFERHTGLREVAGRRVRELVPDLDTHWFETYGRILRTGQPERFVNNAVALGRWYDVFAFRMGPPEQSRVAVLFADITARRRAEEAVRESEERQAFLLRLGDAVGPLTEPDAIVAEACRLLAERLDVQRAYYVEIDEAAGTARIGRDVVRGAAASLRGEHRLADFAWSVAILRRGECHVVGDTQASELVPPPDRPVCAALGIIACMGAPLIKAGRLLGALCVVAERPRAWTEAETEILREVAERIWTSIERARAKEALRTSEERYRTLFTSIDSGFCINEMSFDAPGGRVDYRVLEANPAFYRHTGFNEAILGRWLREAAPALEEHWYDIYGHVARTGEPARFEQGSDMLGRWFDVYAFRVGAPEMRRVAVLFNDISARRSAEARLRQLNETLEQQVAERTASLMAAQEALRQAQKLEAIGQLTGGIAHDFNNMLQGVAGGLDMARRRMASGRLQEAAHYLDAARDATGRAAGLTRRLLAFARQQQLEPRPLDPDALVRGMAEMLRRTIGPAIALDLELQEGCGFVSCDPNELESALLNLCINARDAMPEGGRLVVSTRDRRLSAADLEGAFEAAPGDFVEITVADSGTGMPPEVLERAVDPFFTTKPLGQGTGLGLSQVYGFARQSGGALRIESSPGGGTTVRLWLPFTPRRPQDGEAPREAAAEAQEGSGATLLLLDDETGVREPAAARLRDLGYQVVEASDGPRALALLAEGLRPDLLVTDVGLPGGMDGTRVAEAATRLVPGLPVLFMTGYATTPLPPGAEVIAKPFTLDALTARVRSAIAAAG